MSNLERKFFEFRVSKSLRREKNFTNEFPTESNFAEWSVRSIFSTVIKLYNIVENFFWSKLGHIFNRNLRNRIGEIFTK